MPPLRISILSSLVRSQTETLSSPGYASCLRQFISYSEVYQLYDAASDTQGYIARDDDRKEIVIAFRGA